MNESQIQMIPEMNEATSEQRTEVNELVDTLNKIFRDYRIAMYEFNDAMKRRDEIAKRAQKRVHIWTILGMAGLLLIIGVLFFLVLTLTENLKFMSEQLSSLNRNLTVATTEMGTLKQNFTEMKTQFSQIPGGTSSETSKVIANVNDKVNQVQTSLDQFGTSLNSVLDNVDAMRSSMTKMNKRIGDLSSAREDSYPPRYGFPRRY